MLSHDVDVRLILLIWCLEHGPPFAALRRALSICKPGTLAFLTSNCWVWCSFIPRTADTFFWAGEQAGRRGQFFLQLVRAAAWHSRANIEGGGVCWLLTSAAWPPPSQLWSTFYRELATRFNTYISTECYRNFTIYVYPFLKKILFLRWKDEDSNLAPNCWEAIPSDVRLRKMRHTVSSRKFNAL